VVDMTETDFAQLRRYASSRGVMVIRTSAGSFAVVAQHAVNDTTSARAEYPTFRSLERAKREVDLLATWGNGV
jgi:hypothetical protein